MSDVWYCIDESDTGDWVTSIWDGLGIPAAQIPSTGESGAAYLFNDIAEQGASPTDEFSSTMLTVPPVGVFTHDEYSALSFTGSGDGVCTATYMAERNGVPYLNPGTVGGEWVITMTIGNQAATVDFIMPQMTAAVSGNVVAVGNSASVNFAMPQMVVAASGSQTVPVFTATIAVTMPQMQVACSADAQAVAGVSANIALTMPQMSVSASVSSTTPAISASISFSMPQMSVYVLSGEFDYYSSAGTRIETLAASTHIEYTL